MTPDLGLIVTGIFAIIAFGWGRGKWLRHVLMLCWLTIFAISAYGADRSTVVGAMIVADMVIAVVAVAVATHSQQSRYDARMIGQLSMVLMPAHFAVAWSHGAVNWTLYASVCNVVFIVQCLIVRGWLDGLGHYVMDRISRLRRIPHLRNRGR